MPCRPDAAWTSSDGLTERRMMLVAPSCSMLSWASRLAPSPTASIEITAATPKMRPRAVRPERSLCSKRLLRPSRSPRQMRPIEIPLFSGPPFYRTPWPVRLNRIPEHAPTTRGRRESVSSQLWGGVRRGGRGTRHALASLVTQAQAPPSSPPRGGGQEQQNRHEGISCARPTFHRASLALPSSLRSIEVTFASPLAIFLFPGARS